MEWYLKAIRQYGDFSTRARRKEYWNFFIFNLLFGLAALLLDNALGLNYQGAEYGPIYIVYSFGMLIPGIAVVVRRLHDTGRSGWMLLIALIPFIGAIWLLVLLATDSQPQENKYGPNPKEIDLQS